MTRPLDVLGVAEVAQLARVDAATVWRWQHQHQLVPDAQLAAGPVWRRSTVVRWLRRTGRLHLAEQAQQS